MTDLKLKHIPLRMCVVCRGMKPKADLFRYGKVAGRHELVADSVGSRAGKGLYICRSLDCVERLQKERRLRRQFLGLLPENALEWMRSSLQFVPESGDPNSKAGAKDVVG